MTRLSVLSNELQGREETASVVMYCYEGALRKVAKVRGQRDQYGKIISWVCDLVTPVSVQLIPCLLPKACTPGGTVPIGSAEGMYTCPMLMQNKAALLDATDHRGSVSKLK